MVSHQAKEMLRCQAGRACLRGLKPSAGAYVVHHDEDASVSPVLIQDIVPQRSTCSNLEVIEVDNFARPGARAPSPQVFEAPSSPL